MLATGIFDAILTNVQSIQTAALALGGSVLVFAVGRLIFNAYANDPDNYDENDEDIDYRSENGDYVPLDGFFYELDDTLVDMDGFEDNEEE